MKNLIKMMVLIVCVVSVPFAAQGTDTLGGTRTDTARAVRNPFWPIGFEGTCEVISPAVRVKAPPPPEPAPVENTVAELPAPTRSAAEAAVSVPAQAVENTAAERREVTEADWAAARKALRIGGTLKVRRDGAGGVTRSCVTINGRVYSDDERVTFTHADILFTWRVSGLTDENTLKLIRVAARRKGDGK